MQFRISTINFYLDFGLFFSALLVWEYYDTATADWIGYPTRISRYIERLQESGSPLYMYKPGNKNAEGKEERSLTTNPPSFVSTYHIYYSDMIDRQIYTGAGRRVRRRTVGPKPKQKFQMALGLPR